MLRLPVTWPLRYMINSDNRDLEVMAAELKQLIAQMDVTISAAVRAGRPAGWRREPRPRVRSRLRAVGRGRGQSGRGRPPNGRFRVLLDNPAEGYTREVKAALIDAMIENSGPLGLGPDEWLTVAARDNVPARSAHSWRCHRLQHRSSSG